MEPENDIQKIVRQYEDTRPIHDRFCDKMKKLIEDLIRQTEMKQVQISSRIKDLDSVREKVERKNYKDINDITDISGVRIVCLSND